MSTYPSKSSNSVKVITFGGILILITVLISIVFLNQEYSLLIAIIVGASILSFFLYFFANSLNKVMLQDKSLILKKNMGKIEIAFSEIKSINTLQPTAITMTKGSKGIFGFVGTTMDGTVSLIKNRKQMILLTTTSNKKYLFSCDNKSDLVAAVSTKIKGNTI